MADTNTLQATHRRRSGTGALKLMRREGLIPAIVYGKTTENENIKVNAREFEYLLHHSASENILVNLDIEGRKTLALIQDVQHDPMTSAILHADFLAVSANEAITAELPIETTGSAPGVKGGGVLDLVHFNVEVSCLPKDLPETIVVDISALEIGDAIKIADLKLPEGVSATGDPESVLIIIHEPKVADETEGTPEEEGAASAEPEVIREKKPEGGE